MPLTNLLQKSKKFEIQSYKKHFDPKEFSKTHVPFTGSPKKHPYNRNKIILLTEPYGRSSYYEFETKDIVHVEELPNVTNPDQETVTMLRIWVKKQSIGLHCSPFIVEELKLDFPE
ncbi:MAG: inorganic pyrophosphatase Ppa [Spirochaetes bacterium]|nr:inorganic pyrophosphatase Ppa [Spirochaetota bacterium]